MKEFSEIQNQGPSPRRCSGYKGIAVLGFDERKEKHRWQRKNIEKRGMSYGSF